MRVGLLAYLLHSGTDYRAAGVSRYSHELLKALPKVTPGDEYTAFIGADAPALMGVNSVTAPLPTHHAMIRIAWEQIGFPLQARERRLNVLHGLVNVVPQLVRIPSVVTVHDLAFVRHPDRFHRAKAAYLRTAVRNSVRKAVYVIAVSENTRDDLVQLLDVAESRISVVYPGVDSSFRVMESDTVTHFRQKTLGSTPYILHVGTLEPRKNIDVLIRAFAQLKQDRNVPHMLVLVGAPGWMYENLARLARDLGVLDSVRFQGYVGPETLPLWYNGADLFVYPSAYEGFGFPVLEAMACGVPTITSSSSSLLEVAGSACLTVEVGSGEALLVAFRQLLADSALRERLRSSGLERASMFRWERTAAETVAVYQRVRRD